MQSMGALGVAKSSRPYLTAKHGALLFHRKQTLCKVHTRARSLPFRPTCFTILSSLQRRQIDIHDTIKNAKPAVVPTGSRPFLCMLITPEFWKSIDGSPDFIPSLLQKVFPTLLHGHSVNLLTAVVDSIPFPSSSSGLDESAEAAVQAGRVAEGFSIAILDEEFSAPSLWRESDSRSMSADDASVISFKFAGIEQGDLLLRLPLANTVFVNGRVGTMHVQRWMKDDSKDDGAHFILQNSMNMNSQYLNLLSSDKTAKPSSTASIISHLRQLTRPRMVRAVTGNILRQISGDDGVIQPASREIEALINQALREGQLEEGPVDVWALVEPKDRLDRTSLPESSVDLMSSFMQGGRLYKVLSGGGGWGQKQGLLALDPHSRIEEEDIHSRDDEEASGMELFANLVKPGEIITFLISDKTSKRHEASSANSDQATTTFNFSSADPGYENEPCSSELGFPRRVTPTDSFTYIPDHFGMSSARGIYLQHLTTKLPNRRGTKIDAPGTVISIFSRWQKVSPLMTLARGKQELRNERQNVQERGIIRKPVTALPRRHPHLDQEKDGSRGELQDAVEAAKLSDRYWRPDPRTSKAHRRHGGLKIRFVHGRRSVTSADVIDKSTNQDQAEAQRNAPLIIRKHLKLPDKSQSERTGHIRVPNWLRDEKKRRKYEEAILQGVSQTEAVKEITTSGTRTLKGSARDSDDRNVFPTLSVRKHISFGRRKRERKSSHIHRRGTKV